ncbi:NACHT domain-containing protein [Pilimelia columellifera]|uniref:NACHT domain-containing protein n=1 Tax=Pilimelia columellifera subsp. columellifera TaxID=706583 RepID=A0ABN3NGD4_9ACTN
MARSSSRHIDARHSRGVIAGGVGHTQKVYIQGSARASDASDPRQLLANRVVLVETAALEAARQGHPLIELTMIGPNGEHHDFYQVMTRLRPSRGGSRLVLLGAAGAGKTVTCQQLVVKLAERARTRAAALIPVRLSAATWTVGRDLLDWFAASIRTDYGVPAAAADDLVKNRMILPVIDGLDELGTLAGEDDAGRRHGAGLLHELNQLQRVTARYPVVVTSREDYYQQLTATTPAAGNSAARLAGATTLTISPITPDTIRDYLTSTFEHDTEQLAAWQPVISQLGSPAGRVARSVLATPWRLVLATTVMPTLLAPSILLTDDPTEDPTTDDVRASELHSTLLTQFIPAAVAIAARKSRSARRRLPRRPRWPRPALLDQRYLWIRPHPAPERAVSWLRALAQHQHRMSERPDAPAEARGELAPHLLWALTSPLRLRIVHLACAFSLSLGAVFVGLAALALSMIGDFAIVQGTGGWWAYLSAATGGIVGVAVSVRCYRLAWPQLHDAARIQLPWRQRVRAFGAGARTGYPSYLLYLLALYAIGTVVRSQGFGLAVAVAAALVGAVANGFARLAASMSTSWATDVNVATPIRAVRRATRAQAIHLFARASTSVPTFCLVARPWVAAVISLAGSCVFFLAMEPGTAVLRYHLGLMVAAAHRVAPVRMGRFLEWSTAIGVLRVSGAAYQFRHRELYEWLLCPPEVTQDPADQ